MYYKSQNKVLVSECLLTYIHKFPCTLKNNPVPSAFVSHCIRSCVSTAVHVTLHGAIKLPKSSLVYKAREMPQCYGNTASFAPDLGNCSSNHNGVQNFGHSDISTEPQVSKHLIIHYFFCDATAQFTPMPPHPRGF
jgi:hypothetical protein